MSDRPRGGGPFVCLMSEAGIALTKTPGVSPARAYGIVLGAGRPAGL